MAAQAPRRGDPALIVLLVIAVLAVVAGAVASRIPTSATVGTHVAQLPDDRSVVERLYEVADRVATRSGGNANDAEAVLLDAERVPGGLGDLAGDAMPAEVWLVQVRGHYACANCGKPCAAAPKGTALLILVDPETYGVLGVRLDTAPINLRAFGRVLALTNFPIIPIGPTESPPPQAAC